ncbi:MAG: 16S rRNA (adenine(1518)-N(6)/adenine(1519)-N(6))-dimethyltransferase RsmA [Verrucomicrobiales bacterium]
MPDRPESPLPRRAARAKMRDLGVAPRRSRGQSFLTDRNIARWIVEQVGIGEDDLVAEVGPGMGALTEHLVGAGARRLLCVEVDPKLAAHCEAEFAPRGAEIIGEDATRWDARALFAEAPAKLVSNLPYSVAGDIMRNLLGSPSPFCRAVLMLQKEVAERICAEPRTKAYGAFTLRLAAHWVPQYLKTVPPAAFTPAPKVQSAVIALEPRPAGALPAFDYRIYDRLVRVGFSQRRKQLKNLLPAPPQGAWAEAADACGLADNARAEELSLADWVALARFYDDHPLQHAQSGDELFDVVDENDAVLRQEKRAVVHRERLLHRAIHIFLANPRGEIFLQRRSHLKDVAPCRWDSSAAGHLDAGEGYAAAAEREIVEELGIAAPVETVAKLPASERTDFEFVTLFAAKAETNRPKLRWPASEIESGEFFAPETIDRWTQRRPGDFANGFLQCWEAWRAAGR